MWMCLVDHLNEITMQSLFEDFFFFLIFLQPSSLLLYEIKNPQNNHMRKKNPLVFPHCFPPAGSSDFEIKQPHK